MKFRSPYRLIGLIAILFAGNIPVIFAGQSGTPWIERSGGNATQLSAKLIGLRISFGKEHQPTGYLYNGRIPPVVVYAMGHPSDSAPKAVVHPNATPYSGAPTLSGFLDHLDAVAVAAEEKANEPELEESDSDTVSASSDSPDQDPDSAADDENGGSEIVLQTTSLGMPVDDQPLFKRPEHLKRLEDRFFLYFPITELSHDEVILGQGAFDAIFVPPAQPNMRSSATLREQR